MLNVGFTSEIMGNSTFPKIELNINYKDEVTLYSTYHLSCLVQLQLSPILRHITHHIPLHRHLYDLFHFVWDLFNVEKGGAFKADATATAATEVSGNGHDFSGHALLFTEPFKTDRSKVRVERCDEDHYFVILRVYSPLTSVVTTL